MKKQSSIKKIIGIVGFMVIIAGIIYSVSGNQDSDEDMLLLREYHVSKGNITASLDGVGKIETMGINHGFDVSLVIEDILVKEGQLVSKGDILASYSKEDIEEKIQELKDSLNKAQRGLEDAINIKKIHVLNRENSKVEWSQTKALQYEEQRKELKKAMIAIEKNISKLKEERTNLQNQIKKVEATSDGNIDNEKSKEMRELLNKKSELEKKLTNLQKNNQQRDIWVQIENLETQINSLENQLSEVNRKINGINSELDRITKLKKELKDINDQIAALPDDSDQLLELEEKVMLLQSQIDSISDNSGQLAGLISQRTSLKQQISSLNNQIDTLKNSIYISGEIAKLQKELDEIQEEINKHSSKEDKLKQLKEELKVLETEIEAVMEQLRDKELDLEDLNEKREKDIEQEAQKQVNNEEVEILILAGMDNAIKSFEEEISKLHKEITESQQILKTPVLTAQVDGVISKVNYQSGEKAIAGKSVVTIGGDSSRFVTVNMAQVNIGKIQIEQHVEFSSQAFPDQVFKGIVTEKNYSPIEGQDDIYYKVTIKLEETDYELLEGMTGHANFIIKQVKDVLRLSNKAIRMKDGKQIVTIKHPDGTLEEVEIITGFSDGKTSEIKSGLSEGDIVVVEG